MRTDSPQAHPTLPHVLDGERTDVSSSEIPPNHPVVAEVRRVLISCGAQPSYQRGY
jgi:hypothetical protein